MYLNATTWPNTKSFLSFCNPSPLKKAINVSKLSQTAVVPMMISSAAPTRHARLKHQVAEDPSASQIQIRATARQYLLSAPVTVKMRMTAASISHARGNLQLPHMLSACLTNPRDQNTKNSLNTL